MFLNPPREFKKQSPVDIVSECLENTHIYRPMDTITHIDRLSNRYSRLTTFISCTISKYVFKMRSANMPIKEGYNTPEVKQYIIQLLQARIPTLPGFWTGTTENESSVFREMVADLARIDIRYINEYPRIIDRVIAKLDMCKGMRRIADIAEAMNHPDKRDKDGDAEFIKRVIRSLVEKQCIPERGILEKMLESLQNHVYVLHGGGKKLGDRTYSKSAANIIKKIQALPASEIDYSDPAKVRAAKAASKALILEIGAELKDKSVATSGFWIGRRGAREQSTAALYTDILKLAKSKLESPPEDSGEGRLYLRK